jgi:transcriptional regulator with XRE-family HTH domain
MAREQRKAPPEPKALPALLREIRKGAGESLKSAGPELGVTYGYLSKIENGFVAPSAELLGRIASFYGTSQDELMLAAGRLPPDVVQILQQHPQEAVALLRKTLGRDRPRR